MLADPVLIAALGAEWPLGASLGPSRPAGEGGRPELGQRRRRAAVDPRVPASARCPIRRAFEGLVQVYLDTQHDFLEDRLYLAAAPRRRAER